MGVIDLIEVKREGCTCECLGCERGCELRKQASTEDRPTFEVKSLKADTVRRIGAPTPEIPIRICAGKHVTEVRVCPDSGATTDLILENTAKKIGMNILPNKDNWKVVDAEGKPVKISGVGTVDLARPRGRWRTYTLIVCPKISDAMCCLWRHKKD